MRVVKCRLIQVAPKLGCKLPTKLEELIIACVPDLKIPHCLLVEASVYMSRVFMRGDLVFRHPHMLRQVQNLLQQSEVFFQSFLESDEYDIGATR